MEYEKDLRALLNFHIPYSIGQCQKKENGIAVGWAGASAKASLFELAFVVSVLRRWMRIRCVEYELGLYRSHVSEVEQFHIESGHLLF